LLAFVLERLFPARPRQKAFRKHFFDDFLHLVFNGHFLGIIVFGIASGWLLPGLDRLLGGQGLTSWIGRDVAATWPLWVQIPVAIFFIDFLQWGVHYLLHRVPLFWKAHQCHHSVKDGEMDWIVAFRFQWTEIVIYRALLYLPLAWLGFGAIPVMVHAVFGTLIGHLNHANLDWDYGPLKYLLNNPRMHIWHHDYNAKGTDCGNFGIIFSCWDWIFGTARMPDHPPERIGFQGDDEYPTSWAEQELWPLSRNFGSGPGGKIAAVLGVAALIAGGWWLSKHPLNEVVPPPSQEQHSTDSAPEEHSPAAAPGSLP
jgi:sterol desaturase/sphingolipid hydroxylase (fatty acid hydroxylase superfamily)